MWLRWFVALEVDRVCNDASDGAGDGDRAVWILVLVCIVACCLLLVAKLIEGLDNDEDAKSDVSFLTNACSPVDMRQEMW